MLAQVTNLTGSAISTPIYLVIARIEPSSVVVKGADGIATEGGPYYVLDGPFGPGQSLSRDVVFAPTVDARLPPFTIDPDAYHEGEVNEQPVAVANGDSEGTVGVRVELDGRASYDPDNGPLALTYEWDVQRPAGSTAGLDNPESPTPHLTPDLPGAFRFELKVFDGKLWSLSDEHLVTVVPGNSPPEARAGPDQQTKVDLPTVLDGTASFDPDGDLISFSWELLEAPDNSQAALDDTTLANPQLRPDLPGDYRFRLIVFDGTDYSLPAYTTVTATLDLAPPNADAGPDQEALVGVLVTLNGSLSQDPNGLSLTYQWSFESVPPKSAIVDGSLSAPQAVNPQFVPDIEGRYRLLLKVDNGTLSDEDRVEIRVAAPNLSPVADAGPDVATRTSDTATLDGIASYDPDNGPASLAYTWDLASRPSSSERTAADISGANQPIASFQPDVEGQYLFRLEVSDGRDTGTDNTLLTADDQPPSIAITDPADGVLVKTKRPTLTVTYSDEDSRVDTTSFSAELDGQSIGSRFTLDMQGASYRMTEDLPTGDHTLDVRIDDNAGNRASAQSRFRADYLLAIPGATPTSGQAPLTVNFTSDGRDPGGTIEIFRWDFDGNGTWDTYDTVARDYPHTYNRSGTYNATLLAQSSTGETASAMVPITVENSPPIATADVQPSNGAVPLIVQLLGTGTDPDGSVVLYEWDFEGDGTYDWSSTTSGNATYTYTQEGTFQAIFRATDNDGLSTTTSVQTTAVKVGPPGSPSVIAQASPTSGDAPLTVQFNGTATDPNNDITLYEWDFDGDGTFDWSSTTSPQTSYTYNATGNFLPSLRVTDATGLTGVDPILIMVGIQVSLSVERDTVGFPSDYEADAVVARASSDPYGYAQYLIDGNTGSWWYSNYGDTPAAGQSTYVEVQFGKLQRVTGLTVHWGYYTSGEQYCCGEETCSTVCEEYYDWCDHTGCYYTQIYAPPYTEYSFWYDYSTGNYYSCNGPDCPRPPEESCNDGSAYCYKNCYQNCSCTQYCYRSIFDYYGFTAARIDVYDGAGNLLHSQQETFPGDLGNVVSTITLPAIENATRVRITGLASTRTDYTYIAEVAVARTPMPEPEPEPDEPIGTNINTTLSAPSPVTIQVLDANGNVARTLVNNQFRSGGNYSDYWDTRSDLGHFVNDGVYYAVMHYVADGKPQTLDLTRTTGGQRSDFPFGSGCDSRANFDGDVRPFEDKQMAMPFTLCSAQEVTAFIGPLWTAADETRIRTIANRQVYPAGAHTIYWDGLDDAGNVAQAPPGDDLITGFWRYSLPANAMVMTGGRPVITGVVATPNYFSPFSEECRPDGYGAGMTLTYAISEPAQSIELRVYSIATGGLLRRQTLGSVSAGENAVFWDGKNNQGEYVDIGDYQLGLVATDAEGNASMLRYTLVRIDY